MNASAFIQKWRTANLDNWHERAAFQTYFNDLCAVVGHEPPVVADPDGTTFKYETFVIKPEGGKGFADVAYKGKFAWEHKGRGKSLKDAHDQLTKYIRGLGNPPLLVVGDFETIVIHTNFNNTAYTTYEIALEEIDQKSHLLEWLFHDPEKLKPPMIEASLAEKPRLSIRFERVDRPRVWSGFGTYGQSGQSPIISGETEYRIVLTNDSYKIAKSIVVDLKIEATFLNRPEMQRQLHLGGWEFVGPARQYLQLPRQHRFEGTLDDFCLPNGEETILGHLEFWVTMARNSPELKSMIRKREKQMEALNREIESGPRVSGLNLSFDPRTKQGNAFLPELELQALKGSGGGLIPNEEIQRELLSLYHSDPAKDEYTLAYKVRAEWFSAFEAAEKIVINWRN